LTEPPATADPHRQAHRVRTRDQRKGRGFLRGLLDASLRPLSGRRRAARRSRRAQAVR
jgi:hypothetical protein